MKTTHSLQQPSYDVAAFVSALTAAMTIEEDVAGVNSHTSAASSVTEASLADTADSSFGQQSSEQQQRTQTPAAHISLGRISATAVATQTAVTATGAAAAASAAVVVVQQPLAATVYAHALHSIFRFLSLREFATVAVRVCRHWLSAAVSLAPAQITQTRTHDLVGSCRESEAHTKLVCLHSSRLRQQCTQLFLRIGTTRALGQLGEMTYLHMLRAFIEFPSAASLSTPLLQQHMFCCPPRLRDLRLDLTMETGAAVDVAELRATIGAVAQVSTLRRLEVCVYFRYGYQASMIAPPPFLKPLATLPSLIQLQIELKNPWIGCECQLCEEDIAAITTLPALTSLAFRITSPQLQSLLTHTNDAFRERMQCIQHAGHALIDMSQESFNELCRFSNLRSIFALTPAVRDYTHMRHWSHIQTIACITDEHTDIDSLIDALPTMSSLHTLWLRHASAAFSQEQLTRLLHARPPPLHTLHVTSSEETRLALSQEFPAVRLL